MGSRHSAPCARGSTHLVPLALMRIEQPAPHTKLGGTKACAGTRARSFRHASELSGSSSSLAGPTLWYRDHSAASTRERATRHLPRVARPRPRPRWFLYSKSRVSSSSSPATGVNAPIHVSGGCGVTLDRASASARHAHRSQSCARISSWSQTGSAARKAKRMGVPVRVAQLRPDASSAECHPATGAHVPELHRGGEEKRKKRRQAAHRHTRDCRAFEQRLRPVITGV